MRTYSLGETYGKALKELTQGKSEHEQEALFQNFLLLLKRRGHRKVLSEVLRTLKKKEDGKESAMLTLAKEGEKEDALREARACTKEYDFAVAEDPRIIGGFIARTKDMLVDGSHRGALLRLYKKLRSI